MFSKNDIPNIKDRVIAELYNRGFICNNYTNTSNFMRKIAFDKLGKEYDYRKNFISLIKELNKEGFLWVSGKGIKNVISINITAANYINTKYPALFGSGF